MTDRSGLLHQLLRLNRPVREVVGELRPFGWDSAQTLAELRREDIVQILERYLRGELTAAVVEEWANAVEGREDVAYERPHDDAIRAAIHELANPYLARSLSPQTAREWIQCLR
jgi:hypothetical protein